MRQSVIDNNIRVIVVTIDIDLSENRLIICYNIVREREGLSFSRAFPRNDSRANARLYSKCIHNDIIVIFRIHALLLLYYMILFVSRMADLP